MPKGRTAYYQIFRVCERFGQTVEWFYELPREKQTQYLKFESVREREESEEALQQAKIASAGRLKI